MTAEHTSEQTARDDAAEDPTREDLVARNDLLERENERLRNELASAH